MSNSSSNKRIYLSPPHLSGREAACLAEALASNWITSAGPQLDQFEQAFADHLGMRHAIGVASGTAALHLAVRCLDLRPGDEVLCPTLTFVASANPIVYERAAPVFVDSELASWNVSPALVTEELERCARRGRLPRAVIGVDLFGQPADWGPLMSICRQYEVPVIEDAAESLGACYRDRPAGTFGWANVFSFNGNKIITTSGGGMLVTDSPALADRARFLAQQARDSAPHYEHSQVGYNYRLSNLLAAVGLAQLGVLEERVAAKRCVFRFYQQALANEPGIAFMPEAPGCRPTHWLSCITVDPSQFGATAEEIRLHLEGHNIEARPVWKPMHLQPVFRGCRVIGGHVAEALFRDGLCLPSGSGLTRPELERIAGAIRSTPRRP